MLAVHSVPTAARFVFFDLMVPSPPLSISAAVSHRLPSSNFPQSGTTGLFVRQSDLLQKFHHRSEPDFPAFTPGEHRMCITRIKSAESDQLRATSGLAG
jgi:hypothetical protein